MTDLDSPTPRPAPEGIGRLLAEIRSDTRPRPGPTAATPPRPDPQAPARDWYRAVCSAVASAYADYGFRFALSGPRLTARGLDGMTFRIEFESSTHSGPEVCVTPFLSVQSAALTHGAGEAPATRDATDTVLRGNLGNLRPILDPAQPAEWAEFWVGRETKAFEEGVRRIVDLIDTVAIPLCALAADPSGLAARASAVAGQVPGLGLGQLVRLLMCAGRPLEEAAGMIARYVTVCDGWDAFEAGMGAEPADAPQVWINAAAVVRRLGLTLEQVAAERCAVADSGQPHSGESRTCRARTNAALSAGGSAEK